MKHDQIVKVYDAMNTSLALFRLLDDNRDNETLLRLVRSNITPQLLNQVDEAGQILMAEIVDGEKQIAESN